MVFLRHLQANIFRNEYTSLVITALTSGRKFSTSSMSVLNKESSVINVRHGSEGAIHYLSYTFQ